MKQLDIIGLEEIEPNFLFEDERGEITEFYRGQMIQSVKSARSNPGTLRGVHVQHHDKIVRPISGDIFSLFVDTRRGSVTYGCVNVFIDTGDKHSTYYVPAGVGMSYCVFGKEPSVYLYLSFEEFDPDGVDFISTEDFSYPIKATLISDQDKRGAAKFKDYEYVA